MGECPTMKHDTLQHYAMLIPKESIIVSPPTCFGLLHFSFLDQKPQDVSINSKSQTLFFIPFHFCPITVSPALLIIFICKLINFPALVCVITLDSWDLPAQQNRIMRKQIDKIMRINVLQISENMYTNQQCKEG